MDRIDLVTFALDGPLVDVAAGVAEAANRTFAQHGLPERPADEIAALLDAGTRSLILRLLARACLERPSMAARVRPDRVLADFEGHYAGGGLRPARARAGAADALHALRGAGVQVACVTNLEARHARAALRASGLADAFPLVVAGDTLPERKPHGSVLRHVARTLGVGASTAAHLGDGALDVEAARNAGVAAWTLLSSVSGAAHAAHPDRTFRNLPELAEHVLAARAAVPA